MFTYRLKGIMGLVDSLFGLMGGIAKRVAIMLSGPAKKIGSVINKLVYKIGGEDASMRLTTQVEAVKDFLTKNSDGLETRVKKTISYAVTIGIYVAEFLGNTLASALEKLAKSMEGFLDSFDEEALKGRRLLGKVGVLTYKMVRSFFRYVSSVIKHNPISCVLVVMLVIAGLLIIPPVVTTTRVSLYVIAGILVAAFVAKLAVLI